MPQNLCLSPWHSLCSTDPAFPVQSPVSAGSWQGREDTQVRILQGGFPKRGSSEGEGKGDWSTEKGPRSGTAPKPGSKRVTTGSWKPEGGGKGYPQLCPSEDTQGGGQGMAHSDPLSCPFLLSCRHCPWDKAHQKLVGKGHPLKQSPR